jgi:hypothetical protein
MRCPEGCLIPREGTEGVPKWAKFYNWPRDKNGNPEKDRPGFPVGKDIPELVVEVPNDHHHSTLVVKGPCSVTRAPKKPKGDK